MNYRILMAIAFLAALACPPALCANGEGGGGEGKPPRIFNPPKPPDLPPPPRPPVTLPPTPPPFRPPLTVPTDAVNTLPPLLRGGEQSVELDVSAALAGLAQIHDFPSEEKLKGPTDFILFEKGNETSAQKISPYMVDFEGGQILVAVRKPSNLGMVDTPFGRISISADTDVLISYKDGVLRIANLDGIGTTLRVHLNKGPFAGGKEKVLSVAAGYELVVTDHKLTRAELRPADGVLRRNPALLGDGNLAITQFSLESVLNNSTLVAQMNQAEAGSKERRILSDMSRMAAVLNHVNGTEGYTP